MIFLKLAVKDIRLVGVTYKLGQICGVVPFYDFKKFDVEHQNFKNSQAVIYILIAIFGTIEQLYLRFYFNYQYFSLPYLIINNIKEVFLIMSIISAIFAASFYNQKKWKKFNNQLQYIDSVFNNRNIKEKKCKIYVQILIYFSLYMIYFAFIVLVFSSSSGFIRLRMYWLNEIAFFIDTFLQFLMFSFALALYSRYYQLNCLFKEEKISMESMQKIQHISRILSEATNSYNAIFGWPILFICGKCVSHMLQSFVEILISTRRSIFIYNPFDMLISVHFGLYTLVNTYNNFFNK